MSYLANVFVCIAVFIDAGAAKLNEQRFNIITSNKESAIVRVGMLITSISDVNFKQSVSLLFRIRDRT
ncbi:unnamed protein product [Toxocara canis]|uniref:Secreted protein n=1 Tax=Toxocara canis TaxID=6265 RepID=A0A183UJV4_TOXCA|nr:unnamed protein product [Toxocara canis]